jgi:hypothetical protein
MDEDQNTADDAEKHEDRSHLQALTVHQHGGYVNHCDTSRSSSMNINTEIKVLGGLIRPMIQHVSPLDQGQGGMSAGPRVLP